MCGDLRGNLVLFPLLKSLLLNPSVASEVKISPINYFKGVHGISSVSSVSFARLSSNQTEICSVLPKLNLSSMPRKFIVCIWGLIFLFFSCYFVSSSDRRRWLHMLFGI